MRILLDVILLLPSGADSLPAEIINHTLTTLAHHASTPEAFEVVVEQVILAGTAQLKKNIEWEKLVVVMRAIETIVGVKKGGRVSSEYSIQVFFNLY